MTPDQLARLSEVERRGYIGKDGFNLCRTMRRIAARRASAAHPMHVFAAGERFARARRRWRIELVGACAVIAVFIAVAFFVGTNQ